jgi:hypothetical protein
MTSDWQRWRAGRTQWGEMPPSSVQMAVVHGGRAVARLSCRGVVCNHYQQLESRGMYYRSGWLRRPGAPDESVASAAAPGASRRGDVLAAIVRRRALRGCGQVLVPGAVSDRDRGQSPSRLIAANGRSPALNTGACGLRMVEDSWRHGRYMHLGAGHSNFPCQQRRDAPCSAPCAICAAWKVHPRRAFLRSSNPPVHARRPLVLGCPCRPTWQSRKVHLERLNPAHNPASRLTPPGDCSALLVRSCPIYNYTISRACWCTRLVSSLAKNHPLPRLHLGPASHQPLLYRESLRPVPFSQPHSQLWPTLVVILELEPRLRFANSRAPASFSPRIWSHSFCQPI